MSCPAKCHGQINMFTVCVPNCLPMLMSCSYLFSHQAFYSLRSGGALLSLLSRQPWDSRLAHTAGILPAQAKAGSKSGGTDKISSSWAGALHFRPLLCHIPWVEDKTPTDTKCSLNVCRAEIMWTHQECLQERLSSRWVVNFVKLIDCDI